MSDVTTGALQAAANETAKLLAAIFLPFAVRWASLGLHVVGGKLGDLGGWWMRTMKRQQKVY